MHDDIMTLKLVFRHNILIKMDNMAEKFNMKKLDLSY